jgi:hypothetical protein
MTEDQIAILKKKLTDEFVPQLPNLLDLTKPAEHMAAKNVSRAFNGFVIQKIAGIDTTTAAKSVVDDYEDNGIDLIYYHQPSRKLFLVQGKLKAGEPFSVVEANAFIRGVRDLLNQRYERFNKNVQDRQAEIDSALDDANEIILVAAHTADILSQNARDALTQFLTDPDKPDARLNPDLIDYGPGNTITDLLEEQAAPEVNDELVIFGCQKIDGHPETYYGQVSLQELAEMLTRHGNALFQKNIRYSLGVRSSDVNQAILKTLSTAPGIFFYLSNGVTAIAHGVEMKGLRNSGRRVVVRGFSVVNGAQTIATTHHFIGSNPQADVSAARVLLTLIQVNKGDGFSVDITRGRNHQNPVSTANFAALDPLQERLHRELAFDGIDYRFRPESAAAAPGLHIMTIEEAAVGLALVHPDPAMPVTLKQGSGKLLDREGREYPQLFKAELSGRKLANAVRLYRRASRLVASNEYASSGQEKLIYRHGRHAIMWLTLGANLAWLGRSDIMSDAQADGLLSAPLDTWREKVRAEAMVDMIAVDKGPLGFFRNMTSARPFVVKLRGAGA